MLRAVVGFIAGFLAVYAIAMGLAVFGVPALAALPYERLLTWMVLGGVVASAALVLAGRSKRGAT